MGVPCEEQSTESTGVWKRDCFCDVSCIEFQDCCRDHEEICEPVLLTTPASTTFTYETTESTEPSREGASCASRSSSESLCPSGPVDNINMGSDCYGCVPELVEIGIPCYRQPTINKAEWTSSITDGYGKRDCFCDQACESFGDCCFDHKEVCKPLFEEKGTSTDSTDVAVRRCSPKCHRQEFISSLTNLGNPQYKLDAECQPDGLFDIWTVICTDPEGILPEIRQEGPPSIRLKTEKIATLCLADRTIQCGERTQEPEVVECNCDESALREQMGQNVELACSEVINFKKEKWYANCPGETPKLMTFKMCKASSLGCESDQTESEENDCVLKENQILPYVSIEGTRVDVNAICDGVSDGLDKWTLYCDANSNGELDDDESRQSYKLKQNPAKIRKKGVKINC
ncbi:Oidioi.mRNA.OKI2018_I69.XSR.g13931.t1.cds [Oikopleura dioica]|uniref:Oidioi.mRNA.OKI2018_I69.XSR.g13931.t1.cds n=1 Tax=Oikopleura dioica TaxID=34765 RepID=A0ABN7S8B5_OIKDI|nr:Oidioi.mRNA.OKI2018_I69.XSR.g13931.t1.cds [Oikopleura dioica]